MSHKGNKDELQNDVVDQLLEDLRKLDQVVQHSSSPSVETWEGIIQEQWKLTKRKRIGETILFSMVALLLISGGYTFMFSAPWLLAVIQGIGLVVAVGVLVYDRSTHREERL